MERLTELGSDGGTRTASITGAYVALYDAIQWLKARGLTCPPIVVSSLLDSPEARRIKDAGMMVGDREVIGILLRELLKPEYRDGCILDGFPRTNVQVESLKLLVARMQAP